MIVDKLPGQNWPLHGMQRFCNTMIVANKVGYYLGQSRMGATRFVRMLLTVACFTYITFGAISELRASEQDRFVCIDANANLRARIVACTKIIDAAETPDQARVFAYFNRGTANYLTGKLEDAIRDYSNVISSQPTNAFAFLERGLVYLKGSQFSNAIKDLSEAIRLNPKFVSAYNNRGIAYVKIKDYQTALSDFNMVLQLDPQHATALYNRSLIYCVRAEYERAIIDLNKATEIQPNNPVLYNQLAWAYLNMGLASEGLPQVNRSLALMPSANAYDTRGAIYEKLGKIALSIQDYGHALSLDQSLYSSAQALKRLLAVHGAGNGRAGVSALISEVAHLVEEHGWSADLARMCSSMQIDQHSNCKFKQITLGSPAPNTLDIYGFNVPEDEHPTYAVMYHLEPLVGTFLVVSLDGIVKSAYFRARGVDYTEMPAAESNRALEEFVRFWAINLESIKGMIAAGILRK